MKNPTPILLLTLALSAGVTCSASNEPIKAITFSDEEDFAASRSGAEARVSAYAEQKAALEEECRAGLEWKCDGTVIPGVKESYAEFGYALDQFVDFVYEYGPEAPDQVLEDFDGVWDAVSPLYSCVYKMKHTAAESEELLQETHKRQLELINESGKDMEALLDKALMLSALDAVLLINDNMVDLYSPYFLVEFIDAINQGAYFEAISFFENYFEPEAKVYPEAENYYYYAKAAYEHKMGRLPEALEILSRESMQGFERGEALASEIREVLYPSAQANEEYYDPSAWDGVAVFGEQY